MSFIYKGTKMPNNEPCGTPLKINYVFINYLAVQTN